MRRLSQESRPKLSQPPPARDKSSSALVVYRDPFAKNQAPRRQLTTTAFYERRTRVGHDSDGVNQAEARRLAAEASELAQRHDVAGALALYGRALEEDPACMPALDGIDRVRMIELNLQKILDDAAAAVEDVTNDAARRLSQVLHLWQPRDATRDAARGFLKIVRPDQRAGSPPARREAADEPGALAALADCCGLGSLAGCISSQRLQRAEQRSMLREWTGSDRRGSVRRGSVLGTDPALHRLREREGVEWVRF
jgi:hypothetical protein